MSSRSRVRFRLHLLPAVILSLFLIAGCQESRPGAVMPAEPTSTSDCRPIHIVGDTEAATRPFALEAEELCQRFGVRPVLHHPSYLTQDLEQFVTDQGDQIDLVILPPRILNVYAEEKLIQPLDRWIDESDPWFTDILPVYRDLYMRFGGHFYGFVFDGDSHLLFYRKDQLEEQGLSRPATWTEYDKVARLLANRPGTGQQYGTGMIGTESKAYQWFASRYASMGGRYFDDKMTPQIAEPLGVQALTNMLQLERDAAPEAAFDWADLNQAFLSGTLPMVVQFSDTARFSYDTKVWKSKVAGLVAWDLVPGEVEGAPRGGIWFGRVLTVTAKSPQPDVAAAVAKYITGPEVSGRMVTRADTINDPYRTSHFEHPVASSLFPDEKTAQDLLQVVRKSLERPMADLTIPGGWDYTQALDRAVLRAMRNEQSPKEALTQVASEWEAITERYGRNSQREAYADWLRRLNGGRS